MQTVAPLYPKCAISQIMKSQWSSNELQYKAKEDFISISKYISSDIIVISVFFCDGRIAIPNFGFFWPFK